MMGKYIFDIKARLSELDKDTKSSLWCVAITMFALLFSYPLVRAVSTAVFLDAFGAKSSPIVWIYSVVGLTLVISLYNKWQVKYSVHNLFLWTSIFSIIFFVISSFLITSHTKIWAYPLYIWKEIYLVLLIHMGLAYLNTLVDFETAKIIYGPVGALGSIGGIIGGILTSYLTSKMELGGIVNFASVFVALACVAFWKTNHHINIKESKDRRGNESPLHSIIEVKEYVFLIALIVMISQFTINLGNFRFNQVFTALVPDKIEKTRLLGQIYSSINAVSLLIQILVMPILFKKVKLSLVHGGIPLSYLIVCFLGFVLGGGVLLPVAGAFIYLKGLDYSLFSAAKELLYYPLLPRQKYGAKYIVDMVVYRFAKGLISVFLVFFQGAQMINSLFLGCIMLWWALIMRLFVLHKKVLKNNS